jgi:hypothetical protein
MIAILILQLFDWQMVHDLVLARVIANEAATHASRGEYVDAANEYGEAYTLVGDPTMVYNEAVCWQKHGAVALAHAAIARYLGFDTVPPEERERAAKLEWDTLTEVLTMSKHQHKLIVWSHDDHDKKFPHGHRH